MKKHSVNIRLILSFLFLFFTLAGVGCSSSGDDEPNRDAIINGGDEDDGKEEEEEPVPGVYVPSAKGMTDMVLLYHTGPTRPQWTAEQIAPFVYRSGEDDKPDWMFDGFLFLEFTTVINGVNYSLDGSRDDQKTADKKLWEWLAEETFAPGRGPNAVEKVLAGLANQGYTPPYKRQVVFGLPNPVPMFKNWGILDRKRLDFSKQEDRVTAVKWYMDLVLAQWKKQDYKYLDFGGFYWVKENITDDSGDSAFLKEVGELIQEMGYEFSWIPYYGADGADKWAQHGFNIAYQQPNHFFSTETPDWFLPESIKYAKTHGLKMELEFDERVAQPEFAERFYKYLDEFEKAGVWEDMPVAHYHGNNGWGLLAEGETDELKAMHKRLGDLISKRQGKFSRIIPKQ